MTLRPFVAATCALAACSIASAAELLVPAYFYPSFDPDQSYWDELTAAAASGTAITAIMNPANGPGAAFNSDYGQAVAGFRAAGGKVLGYVYTCYGGNTCFDGLPPTRSTDEVLADAQRYADWYGVDGVFLDEMSNLSSDLPFYETVASGLRSAQPGWQIVGNPGTSTPEAYLAVADTLVTFERGSGSYDGYVAAPWMLTAAPDRQAHLLYNVTTATQMQTLLSEAKRKNAGYVYITDDLVPNPWDQLPSYWDAEVAAVSAVPEPATFGLMALGLLGCVTRARRRPGH